MGDSDILPADRPTAVAQLNRLAATLQEELGLPDGVTLTPTGLEFERELEPWEMAMIAKVMIGAFRNTLLRSNILLMGLGDLIAEQERRYGDTYTELMDITGLSYQYLANAAYTMRKVPKERRSPVLSYSHHAEVAPLPPAEQTAWLQKAEDEGLSVHDLRHAISRQRDEGAGKPPGHSQALAALQRAAEVVAELDPDEWAGAIWWGLIDPLCRRVVDKAASTFLAGLDCMLAPFVHQGHPFPPEKETPCSKPGALSK